ncbi:MarR family winged helix-turn-helix transcriptional regulator [Tateyamaria sp. Alg231-49]|uniref:MarR family winged helix-turn-helix transcriptional regulator n=1 Tax=Tateyamaria sp. Alg231-49 TaxID=1922219 RepID=UPI000D55F195|nr:MarR family transcriptional regulator [Tateyamaria sp. Alg231-49]
MTERPNTQKDRIEKRRAYEAKNPFSRMDSAHHASRQQGLHILQQSAGLTTVEWRVLWDLHEAGPMTIRDLAQIQRSDPSLISRALPAMERKGFVRMTRGEHDGRQVVVEMDTAGYAAHAAASPAMKRRREALRSTFSEQELSTLVDLLTRFEDALREPVDDILEPEVTQ